MYWISDQKIRFTLTQKNYLFGVEFTFFLSTKPHFVTRLHHEGAELVSPLVVSHLVLVRERTRTYFAFLLLHWSLWPWVQLHPAVSPPQQQQTIESWGELGESGVSPCSARNRNSSRSRSRSRSNGIKRAKATFILLPYMPQLLLLLFSTIARMWRKY